MALLTTATGQTIPWRDGPPLDPGDDDAYREEQADYTPDA